MFLNTGWGAVKCVKCADLGGDADDDDCDDEQDDEENAEPKQSHVLRWKCEEVVVVRPLGYRHWQPPTHQWPSMSYPTSHRAFILLISAELSWAEDPVQFRSGADPGHIGPYSERELITGVWELCPSGLQGQSPWSGGQGSEAPWSWTLFCVVICLKWRKAAMFMSCFMVINGSCSTNMCAFIFYPWFGGARHPAPPHSFVRLWFRWDEWCL